MTIAKLRAIITILIVIAAIIAGLIWGRTPAPAPAPNADPTTTTAPTPTTSTPAPSGPDEGEVFVVGQRRAELGDNPLPIPPGFQGPPAEPVTKLPPPLLDTSGSLTLGETLVAWLWELYSIDGRIDTIEHNHWHRACQYATEEWCGRFPPNFHQEADTRAGVWERKEMNNWFGSYQVHRLRQHVVSVYTYDGELAADLTLDTDQDFFGVFRIQVRWLDQDDQPVFVDEYIDTWVGASWSPTQQRWLIDYSESDGIHPYEWTYRGQVQRDWAPLNLPTYPVEGHTS